MGMFSWKCKGCGADLKMDEIVRMNGCVGEYDGYGRAGGFDASGANFKVVAWHELCFQKATDEQRNDESPSDDAEDQGFGTPNPDFMNPQRIEDAKAERAKKSASVPASLFPLVKFRCGCIGLRPDCYGDAVVFKSCRGETDETIDTMYIEHVDEPNSYEAVHPEKAREILITMIQLVADGHKLRTIQRLLK